MPLTMGLNLGNIGEKVPPEEKKDGQQKEPEKEAEIKKVKIKIPIRNRFMNIKKTKAW